ncbi:hypothetical protein [Streptosporangium sp. KLBMP 9127]|nr:hypothetical protein [Streptosporangium sp. KLBMP 9127]
MQAEDLTGYYTYRSYLNRPEPVDDFNKLKFAEVELYLSVQENRTVTGTLAFPAAPGGDEKNVMDVNGEISDWSPLRLKLTGQGRANSAIADYYYEYDGMLSHHWTAGVKQRLTLTGTVLRAKDHGAGDSVARAGVTASFVAVKRDFVAPRDVPGNALLPAAVAMLAGRSHRLRHSTWHTVRTSWWRPLQEADRAEITQLGWGFARPPFNDKGRLDLINGAGEDFLFMHRRMIRMVNDIYEQAGVPVIAAWGSIPGPDVPQFVYDETKDPQNPGKVIMKYSAARSGFMVPPAEAAFLDIFPEADRRTMKLLKSPDYLNFVMRPLERSFTSSTYLSGLSLGALGNLLEFTIHNQMHMRWASIPRDAQGNVAQRDDFDFAEKWDDPAYDYLGEFYSSHVNPVFWRLHGWVDARIEDWYQAHEAAAPGEIERIEHKGVRWFKPGKWVKAADPFDWPDNGHHRHGDHEAIAVMLKVLRIVQAARERASRSMAGADLQEGRSLGAMSFLRWTEPPPDL